MLGLGDLLSQVQRQARRGRRGRRPLRAHLPSHVPAATAKGFTLSIAKQVLSGRMDEVIETIEHNVRLL
ncbi:MAG: hypothetical protein WB800_05780 [Streptosporangiaceae bacterium]